MNQVCRALLVAIVLPASSGASAQVLLSTGELYRVGCAPCHGADGSGHVPERTFKSEPLNFADCRVATREPDADWALVVAQGGPAAGLSWDMPAFGDSLTREQIRDLVDHLRAFCREEGWPHGNLNLPRPLFTRKAFPEDELAIVPMVSHRESFYTRFRLELEYERRIGRRGQVEIGLPVETAGSFAGRAAGAGDVSLGAKYVLHADRRGTRMLSGGMDVSLPTGNTTRRFGEGTVVVEPYLAAGAAWRRMSVQMAVAWEARVRERSGEDNRHVVYDVYAGRDLAALPGAWTVGVEINGVDRWLAVTPQMRKALTRTGALAVAGGVRLPLNVVYERQYVRWIGYLLWDYRDPVRSR